MTNQSVRGASSVGRSSGIFHALDFDASLRADLDHVLRHLDPSAASDAQLDAIARAIAPEVEREERRARADADYHALIAFRASRDDVTVAGIVSVRRTASRRAA